MDRIPHENATENSYMLVKGPWPVRMALATIKAVMASQTSMDRNSDAFSTVKRCKDEPFFLILTFFIKTAAMETAMDINNPYKPMSKKMVSVFNSLAPFTIFVCFKRHNEFCHLIIKPKIPLCFEF